MPNTTEVARHEVVTGGHTTSFLSAGPADGPLVVLVHGWPELSISWRHQLPVLGGLGFRAVAPDMRGYGASTVYDRHEDYALEHLVGDVIGLVDALGRDRAVFVGHDWGSPVVWGVASHHPDRCHGVASLCVPYATLERGLDVAVALVDRDVYPEDQFPVGQWDYQLHYEEDFDGATAVMDADPHRMVKLLFRKGSPEGDGRPALTATMRAMGGWFGGAPEPPDVPADHDVVTEDDVRTYTAGLERNGFFGPNSYYMNHGRNAEYTARWRDGGKLAMPVLFLAARYDYVCECTRSRLADPMRELCADLTYVTIDGGHWLAQERPRQVSAALVRWLAQRVPEAWPSQT